MHNLVVNPSLFTHLTRLSHSNGQDRLMTEVAPSQVCFLVSHIFKLFAYSNYSNYSTYSPIQTINPINPDVSSQNLGYVLEKRLYGQNANWERVTFGTITDTRYRATGLTPQKTYEFRVAALNAAGQGEYRYIAYYTSMHQLFKRELGSYRCRKRPVQTLNKYGNAGPRLDCFSGRTGQHVSWVLAFCLWRLFQASSLCRKSSTRDHVVKEFTTH